MTLSIRPYKEGDRSQWLRMSLELDPDSESSDHESDMDSIIAREDAEAFFVERPDGTLGGYVEVGARAYADGCITSPVGYIEAWYVDPDLRRGGYGRALLAAAETWARARGYREMASDALLDNDVSFQAHLRSGYCEVDRIVQFRKSLQD